MAALVARGQSNGQIAASLIISALVWQAGVRRYSGASS